MNKISAANEPQTSTLATQPTQPGIGEEFNSFIQLLTAQIRNQDPLSPLDSTQFVEQLATFSSLEQQVRSNSSLDSIAAIMSDMHAIIASDWLGQVVSVESSWVPYSGEAIEFGFDAPANTDRALLTVRDAEGTAIWSEEIEPDGSLHTWDGRTNSGEGVANDTLNQISIELYRGNEYIGSVAPRIVTTVTDIANEGGELRLGTAAHLTTDFSAVRKIDR